MILARLMKNTNKLYKEFKKLNIPIISLFAEAWEQNIPIYTSCE